MKQIIESANVMNQSVTQAGERINGPFHAAYRLATLFWSVFGPAAQYDFGNPKLAYAASMKP
jgi:hypothetical protein